MSDQPAKEKEELLKGLEIAEHESLRIEAAAKETLQNARLMNDTVPYLRLLYDNMSVSALPSAEWARQNQNIKSWNAMAKSPRFASTHCSTFSAMSQAAANTAISGVAAMLPPGPPPSTWPSASTPVACPAAVQQAAEKLVAIVNKYPSMDKARAEIQRLGLDSRGGDSKSAMQLLEEAAASLDIPAREDGSAVGVLLALRACINACVCELLRRRLVHEEAKNWKGKVTSLGRHCARVGLDTAHFDNLGIEAEAINDLLSAAKDKRLNRSETQQLFSKGLLFLVSFLNSIDESKLRHK